MSKIEQDANWFIATKRQEWMSLVAVARNLPPKEVNSAAETLGRAAGAGKSTLKRKLQAIHAAMNEGLSDEKIIALGQKKVMSKYVSESKARDEDFVFLKIGCSSALRKEFMGTMIRLGNILGITQNEQVLEFINSVFSGMTQEDVKALAGEGNVKDKG